MCRLRFRRSSRVIVAKEYRWVDGGGVDCSLTLRACYGQFGLVDGADLRLTTNPSDNVTLCADNKHSKRWTNIVLVVPGFRRE
jgi:hypothetical protein